MEKRSILAIALTIAVWVLWLAFFKAPETPLPENQPRVAQDEKADSKEKSRPEEVGKKDLESDKGKEKKPESTYRQIRVTKSSFSGSSRDVTVETDKYILVLSSKGALMKRAYFKERNIELITPKGVNNGSGALDFAVNFTEEEFLEAKGLSTAVWRLTKINDLTCRFSTSVRVNGNPVTVEKTYFFNKEANDFRLEYRFINRGGRVLEFSKDSVIVSAGDMVGPELDYANTYNRAAGIYSINSDFEQSYKGGGFFSSEELIGTQMGNVDWVGVTSRYCSVVMLPEDFSGKGVVTDQRKYTGYRTGMYTRINPIRPGQETTRVFKVYMGLKDKEALIASDQRIAAASDVSKWIEPIRAFVIWALLWINRFIGNFGVSLIIFSILTKAVFMPLTIKSTESMKKMSALQPKISELKKRYKNKPDVLQREIMKLYKEHKVNPMSGCFPLLLQMPFFIGLYSALINSIDLWHAPFMLWINDLSMPDTIATVGGFNINILPIVMTLSTYFQQRLTTVDTGQGSQQKIMMTVMPIMFIFIFWTMPSGLVLYWTLQNLFQVIQQMYIKKKGEQKAAA